MHSLQKLHYADSISYIALKRGYSASKCLLKKDRTVVPLFNRDIREESEAGREFEGKSHVKCGKHRQALL